MGARNRNIAAYTRDIADVLVFQEAWQADLRDELKAALREQGYVHTADGPEDDSKLLPHSGLFIASRHPIADTASQLFEACSGANCHAAMGFMYAKFCKDGWTFNIVNMHAKDTTEATTGTALSSDQTTRHRQFQEVASWIAQRSPPSSQSATATAIET